LKIWEYIVRRMFLLIFVLLGVTLITFFLSQVLLDPVSLYVTERTTADQIQAIIVHYHLNDPWPIRYAVYVWNLIQGDWGYSLSMTQPVLQSLAARFPATMELAITAIIWTLAAGIPLGIISALKNNKTPDHVSRVVALTGVSTPVFWLGLICQIVFFYYFQLWGLPNLPSNGRFDSTLILAHPVTQITGLMVVDTIITGNFIMTEDVLAHLILPAFCLGFISLGYITRIMRGSMLEVLRQDYIILARSKGLTERVVIYRHALKNAMIPTVTVAGLAIAGLLGGAPLTETVFAWPGMGRLAVNAINRNDAPLIMGFTLIAALVLVFANLIVDILYAYLDPRIKY
jgi:ABC-type dipeptide/oligopeptide/nickel transport system permease component